VFDAYVLVTYDPSEERVAKVLVAYVNDGNVEVAYVFDTYGRDVLAAIVRNVFVAYVNVGKFPVTNDVEANVDEAYVNVGYEESEDCVANVFVAYVNDGNVEVAYVFVTYDPDG
jgi:hypothetical protein